jgi:hypothetical protein
LCIQSHIRRLLIFFEERHHSQFGRSCNPGSPEKPAKSYYLSDAVRLFRGISMGNRKRLLNQIRSCQAQPSVYLGQSRNTQRHPFRSNSWEKWHEEGVIEFLFRQYDLAIDGSDVQSSSSAMQRLVSDTNPRHSHEILTGDEADSDSDGTVSGFELMASCTEKITQPDQQIPANTVTVPTNQQWSATEQLTESLCSLTPRSDLDFETTETHIEEMKSRMINRVVRYVAHRMKVMFLQGGAGSGSTAAFNTSSQAPSSNPGGTGSNNILPGPGHERNQKRKLDERDDDHTDNDGEGPSHQETACSKEEDGGLACPYFKYNPSLYKSLRSCPGPGWPHVHRVK